MKIKKLSVCISFLLVALIVNSAPLVAQEKIQFEPYASIRMYAGYQNQSKELTGTNDDDLDVRIDLIGLSRFGGNFVIDDRLSGNVEIALKDTITLRKAYAKYKFDPFELLFGQDWTPNSFGSSEVSDGDNGSAGFGATDDVRKKQFKITAYGAYLCVLKPVLEPGIGTFDSDTIDSTVPEIVVGYEYSSDMINIGLGFGYQTYKLDDGTDTGSDGESITSTLGFIHGSVNAGIISVLFNAGGGTNFGNLDIAGGQLDWKAQVDVDDKVKDTTCYEGYIELSIKIIEPVMRIGGGYAQAENDTWAETDTQWQSYVHVEFPVYKSFTLTPEFSYRDYMKDENDVDQGTEWWAGAKFQADFE